MKNVQLLKDNSNTLNSKMKQKRIQDSVTENDLQNLSTWRCRCRDRNLTVKMVRVSLNESR